MLRQLEASRMVRGVWRQTIEFQMTSQTHTLLIDNLRVETETNIGKEKKNGGERGHRAILNIFCQFFY